MEGINGNKRHHFLTGPENSPSATLHELGHAQRFTKYERLKYYQTVVPRNQVQFSDHYTLFKPAVKDTVDGARFLKMQTEYTPEIGQDAVRAVQDIINLYFPGGRPDASGGPVQETSLPVPAEPRASSPLKSN